MDGELGERGIRLENGCPGRVEEFGLFGRVYAGDAEEIGDLADGFAMA